MFISLKDFNSRNLFRWQISAIFFLLASALVFTEENENEVLIYACSYIVVGLFVLIVILNILNVFYKNRLESKKNAEQKSLGSLSPHLLDIHQDAISLK